MGVRIKAEVIRGERSLGMGEVVIKDNVVVEDVMELATNPELWEKVIVNGKDIKAKVVDVDYDGGVIVFIK